MAELILKVGNSADPSGYKDGDILCAFSDKHISCVHTQNICNHRNIGFKTNGLRDITSLTFKMFLEYYQYKFERVSDKEVKRTLLSDGNFKLFSDKTKQSIDANLYIQRRLKHPAHLIFGNTGKEIWFGGNTDHSQVKIDNLWTQITAHTGKLKKDHTLWPCGIRDLKDHFALKLDKDLTDIEVQNYIKSETKKELVEGELKDVIVQKRRNYIDWKAIVEISGDTDAKIEKPDIAVDGRDKSSISTDIIQTKVVVK